MNLYVEMMCVYIKNICWIRFVYIYLEMIKLSLLIYNILGVSVCRLAGGPDTGSTWVAEGGMNYDLSLSVTNVLLYDMVFHALNLHSPNHQTFMQVT